MKRIVSVFISICLIFSLVLSTLPVSAEEQYSEYVVPFYSDKCLKSETIGLSNEQSLKNGIVLIPIDIASEIASAEISAQNDNGILVSRGYVSLCFEYEDDKNQYLLVDEKTGEGDFYESALQCLLDSSVMINFRYHPFTKNEITYPVDESLRTKIPVTYHSGQFYVSLVNFLDTYVFFLFL